MFGPHRGKRIVFLAENSRAWLRHSKAGPTRSKPMHFSEKGTNNTPKWDGRNRVWTAQARADCIFREFRRGQARVFQKGLGRSIFFLRKRYKTRRGENVFDRTGASGSLFLRSYGNHCKSPGNYIEPEGEAYLRMLSICRMYQGRAKGGKRF